MLIFAFVIYISFVAVKFIHIFAEVLLERDIACQCASVAATDVSDDKSILQVAFTSTSVPLGFQLPSSSSIRTFKFQAGELVFVTGNGRILEATQVQKIGIVILVLKDVSHIFIVLIELPTTVGAFSINTALPALIVSPAGYVSSILGGVGISGIALSLTISPVPVVAKSTLASGIRCVVSSTSFTKSPASHL